MIWPGSRKRPLQQDGHRHVIGTNIRRIRRARDMSQGALAHRIDIANGTYISKLERGLGNPTAVQIEAIANALTVEPGELFLPPSPPAGASQPETQPSN